MRHGAFLLVIVACTAAAAQTTPPEQTGNMVDLKSLMVEQSAKSGLPSLSVAVVAGDQVVFQQCIGDATDAHQPATPQTFYQIGSMTKVFTAALLVALREQGVVTLDDPIDKFLPAGVTLPADPRGEAHIRLWHLATHTSGLARLPVNLGGTEEDPYGSYTQDRMWEGLGKMRLAYPTGGGNEYSNLGSALLGQVLSRAAGAPYEDLIHRELLKPLKMDESGFALSAQQQPRAAQGHDSEGHAVTDWKLAAIAPAGGLYSTLDDMTKFVAWQLRAGRPNVSPLSGGTLRLMQSPHAVNRDRKMAFGLGWVLKSGPAETGDTVWHNGMTGGHASWTGMVPDMGVGVVVLTNAAKGVDELGERILKEAVTTWGKKQVLEIDPELARVAAALAGYFTPDPRPGLEDLFSPEFLHEIPLAQVQAMFAAQAASLGPCRNHSIIPAKRPQECTADYQFDNDHHLNLWMMIDAGMPARIVGLRFMPVVKVEPVTSAPAKG